MNRKHKSYPDISDNKPT